MIRGIDGPALSAPRLSSHGRGWGARLFSFALSAAVAALLSTAALAADFFVDAQSGSDVTGDGTRGNPWKTLTHALSAVTGPNTTIRVAEGTYDAFLGEVFPIAMKPGVSVVSEKGFRSTVLRGAAVPVGGDGSDGTFRPTVDMTLDTDVQSVYQFTDIDIPGTVRVDVVGSLPLVLHVQGDVLIEGVLDLPGENGGDGVAGAGDQVVLGGSPGAGGGRGGNANDPASSGPAAGQDGQAPAGTMGGGRGGMRSGSLAGGGGGGGHALQGGQDVAGTSGAGGSAYGNSEISVLRGGSGGGAGGNGANIPADTDDTGGAGGGGGGAIFIDARGVVRITGRLKAEGGNGGRGGGVAGGGGGGSGGSIKVRASRIVLEPDSRVLARGGTAGMSGLDGGRPGGDGANGRIRLADLDGIVDTSQAFVSPSAAVGFLPESTDADIVVFPSNRSFGPDTRLSGFTIAGGRRGIFFNATPSGTEHRPRVRGNAVVDCEIGIQLRGANSGVASPFLVSNYVYDNRIGVDVTGTGGTVEPIVSNNTLTINGMGYRVDPNFSGRRHSNIVNGLIWQNGTDLEGVDLVEVQSCNITVSPFIGQNGNTSLNPRFVDKQARDLRLDPSTSPLVDLGTVNALGLDGFDPDGDVRDYDFDADGIRQPDIGADEAGLQRFMLRYGQINGRVGLVQDVLFVNGSAGDPVRRRLTIGRRAPFAITLASAPIGPQVAPYVLYAFLGVPDNPDITRLPLELGTMAFPIPLTGSAPSTMTLVNNIVHPQSKAALGCGLLRNVADAPVAIPIDRGIGARLEISFQALLVDAGSENRQATATNCVVVEVR